MSCSASAQRRWKDLNAVASTRLYEKRETKVTARDVFKQGRVRSLVRVHWNLCPIAPVDSSQSSFGRGSCNVRVLTMIGKEPAGQSRSLFHSSLEKSWHINGRAEINLETR